MTKKTIVHTKEIERGYITRHLQKKERLIQKGLTIEDYTYYISKNRKIENKIYGSYPGGQEQIEKDWKDLNQEFGPSEIALDLTIVAELLQSSIDSVLTSYNFEILEKINNKYKLEYPGSLEEAISTLENIIERILKP